DLRLFHFDAQNNLVELMNVPFGFSDPVLQYVDKFAGTSTFYLGVSDITNTAYNATDPSNQGNPSYDFVGPYTLDLSVSSLADAGDTKDTAVDPQPNPQVGIIDVGGDVDVYHIALNAGDTLDVTTDTSTLGGLGTHLRLFNAAGQPLSTTGN